MSRYFEMTLEIFGHDPKKVAPIRAAAEKEWPFADWFSGGKGPNTPNMQASAQCSLCGGESEEQFTERLSVAIWRANDGFCEVIINATYLGNLPYEIHTLDESEYLRLMQPNTGETA